MPLKRKRKDLLRNEEEEEKSSTRRMSSNNDDDDDDDDDNNDLIEKAKNDLSSLQRVFNRLASIENNSNKLTQVLDKLLPRLLVRIGENNNNNQQKQKTSSSNDDKTLINLLQQIHHTLVNMLSHIIKRVKNDTNCQLPCYDILKLLLNDSNNNNNNNNENNNNDSLIKFVTSNLTNVDSLTLNLSLTFITMGIPRLEIKSSELLLPSLLILLTDCRKRQLLSTSASSTQYVQITQCFLSCLIKITSSTNNSNNNNNIISDNIIEQIRTLTVSSEDIANTVYDLFLDILLYVPTNSTIPPFGLSQSGHERIKNFQVSVIKQNILNYIAPQKQSTFFKYSIHSNYVIILLLIASNNDTSLSSLATAYLKHCLDNTTTTNSSTSNNDTTTIRSSNQSSLLILASELMIMCLGESIVQNNENIRIWKFNYLLPTTTTTATSNQQLLSKVKKRPVSDTTPLTTFVAKKIFDDYPNILYKNSSSNNNNNNNAIIEYDAVVLSVSQLIVQVVKQTLTQVPIELSSIRAKPYIASAQLLSSLTIRLAPYYDDNLTSNITGKDIVTVLSDCLDVVKQVLTPVSTHLLITNNNSNSNTTAIQNINNDGSIAVRDACYGTIATLARSIQFPLYGFHNGQTATMLFNCTSKEDERLRPRTVAALDAILTAYVRKYANNNDDTIINNNSTTESNIKENGFTESNNPWLAATVSSTTEKSIDVIQSNNNGTNNNSNNDRDALARSLLPLIWSAAQTYQSKASRVAAARWTSELLKVIDLPNAFLLLCFLSGDDDVTAASIARDGLNLPPKKYIA